jgi:hypothetical protein
MTNSVTVSAPATGVVGSALAVSGIITPVMDVVSIQLDQQNATLPTGPWMAATTANGTFAGTLTPPAAGTWYAWAYDQITGVSAVSVAIIVPGVVLASVPAVPLSVQQAESLLGVAAAGETPDELNAAGAASDTDTALVSQSGKILYAQPFAAIWTWIQGHLPGYLMPQVTVAIAGTVQLDNSAYNQRVVLITASGVTIAPLIPSMGPGFACDVINASGAIVTLSGITTDTGAGSIAAGGVARILAATSPGGSLAVYAKL